MAWYNSLNSRNSTSCGYFCGEVASIGPLAVRSRFCCDCCCVGCCCWSWNVCGIRWCCWWAVVMCGLFGSCAVLEVNKDSSVGSSWLVPPSCDKSACCCAPVAEDSCTTMQLAGSIEGFIELTGRRGRKRGERGELFN